MQYLFVFLQSYNCNRNTYSSRVRTATKEYLASSRNPARGSFSIYIRGCNKSFISPESGLRQKYLFLQSQYCNKKELWPESGTQHRVCFPDSELQRIIYSSRVRIAPKYSFLRSQDCNKRIFGQVQESSKGFVFQIRDCNRLFIAPEAGLQWINLVLQSQDCIKKDLWPDSGIQRRARFPESGLQQIIHSSRVRNATIGYLASFRNPAKGSLFRVGIATNELFIQDQDYNKTLIPPEDRTIFFIPPALGLQQKCSFLQSQDCNKRNFSDIQESSKGFVSQIRDCNKLINSPASGLQQQGSFARKQECLFLQSQDCN